MVRKSTYLLFLALAAALLTAGCGGAAAPGGSAAGAPGDSAGGLRPGGPRGSDTDPTATSAFPTSLPGKSSVACQVTLIVTRATVEATRHIEDYDALGRLYQEAARDIRAAAATEPGTPVARAAENIAVEADGLARLFAARSPNPDGARLATAFKAMPPCVPLR